MNQISLKTNAGFTLIELLVVLTLMMAIVALVAPMGVNMVDKARAQTEYVQLQSFLKKQSTLALVNATNIDIELSNGDILLQRGENSEQISFEHIRFSNDLYLVFNRNGLPSINIIEVTVGRQVRTLKLDELLYLPNQ